MKKIIVLIIILFVNCYCFSQSFNLNGFNQEQLKITKQGMLVLGGWSAANLVYSGAFIGAASGSDKYFHQMNLIWGGINFSLAAIGYFGAKNHAGSSFAQSLKKQIGVEKTFLFNAGLDLAYIAGGFYLKEKVSSDFKNTDRNKGFGKSIVLQGSALLLFDGIMYLLHNAHGKELLQLSEKMQVGIGTNGIGCIVKF